MSVDDLKKISVAKEKEEEGVDHIEDGSRLSNSLDNQRKLSSEFVTLTRPKEEEVHQETDSDTSASRSTLSHGLFAGQDYDHRLNKNPRGLQNSVSRGIPSSQTINSNKRKEERGDLEVWWVNSPVWRRIIPVMCIILFLLTIAHACATVYYFAKAVTSDEGKDFDVCQTENCKAIANWILLGLNREVDPCENFYEYACGKYSAPEEGLTDVLAGFDFTQAKLQFNQRSLIADALKIHPDDPNKILISFYKSCLNKRRREKNDLKSLAIIINRTNPYMFADLSKFDFLQVRQNLVRTIGNFGSVQFVLFKYPRGALLPPKPWLLELGKRLASLNSGQTEEQLKKIYEALWPHLTKHIGAVQISAKEAIDWTIRSVKDIYQAKFDGKPGLIVPTGPARDKAIAEAENYARNWFRGMFGHNWIPVRPQGSGLKVYPDDIYQLRLVANSTGDLTPEQRNRAASSFALLAILEAYSDDLSLSALEALHLKDFFPTKEQEKSLNRLQQTSLPRYCFEQTSTYLSGFTFARFHKNFQSSMGNLDDMMEKMRDRYFKIRSALNYVHQTDAFLLDLNPYEAFILGRFHDPRIRIAINYPFPNKRDNESSSFYSEMRSFHKDFHPGQDYLLNAYEASVLEQDGKIKSWLAGRIHFEKRRSFHVEKFQIFTDNPMFYENNLSPPIVIFDRPLFLNDMRVFDIAGAQLYLTRNVIDLAYLNIEDPGAMLAVFDDEAKETVKNSKQLINDFGGECTYDNKTYTRRDFLHLKEARSALTFKVAYRTLTGDRSGILIRKADGVPIVVVPIFNPDGSSKFVELFTENNVSKFKEVNQDDYVFMEKDKFKFEFKRAPEGLEEYSINQLFFLAGIRHHCRTLAKGTQRTDEYIRNVNRVLEQVDEFSEAWDCPVGSKMNPSHKCI